MEYNAAQFRRAQPAEQTDNAWGLAEPDARGVRRGVASRHAARPTVDLHILAIGVSWLSELRVDYEISASEAAGRT